MDLPRLTKVLIPVNVVSSGPNIMLALIIIFRASNFQIWIRWRTNWPPLRCLLFLERILIFIVIPNWASSNYCPMLACSNLSISLESLFLCLGAPALHFNSGPWIKKVLSVFLFMTQHMAFSLNPEANRLDFEWLIPSDWSNYKQFVDDYDWTHVPRSDTLAAEPTLPSGYQAAIPAEPLTFHTMMCQAISTSVAAAMYASTQAIPYPTGSRSGSRGGRGGWGGNSKQVSVTGNCNCCGKSGNYVRDCPQRNTYWDPHHSGTEDTATNVY